MTEMPELDDLRSAWATLERRLERESEGSLALLREIRLDKTRGRLRWLMSGQAVQIAIWIAALTVIGPFWIEHRDVPHLLVFGLVLHGYGVLTIVTSVVQLLLMARIDYSEPVVTIQRQLAELRQLRIRNNLLLTLPWWLVWVVALEVLVLWWSGIDLYAASPAFIFAALGVGVVGLVVTVVWIRRLVARAERTGGTVPMADDLAGHGLSRALAELDEVARFENGDAP